MNMNINIILASVFLIGIILIYIWLDKVYKKKMASISEELRFFKKEKEYYDEVMMVFSKDFDIIFANQSAKELFQLDQNNNRLPIHKNIELKIDTSDPIDFFELLKKQCDIKEDNFHLQNVLLVISGKMKQVNIYVDKSNWNVDQTVTCIIDMQALASNKIVTTAKEGGKDFLTGLPSQFSALTDINTLVIESHKESETVTLFLLGIDHFSELQTTLGQRYTNQFLKNIATYFDKNVDENTQVYRMDCDKFLLVLHHVSSGQEACDIAKKLIMDVGEHYKKDNNTHITTSIGIARYPDHGENAAKLIDHLYIALAQAQKESDANIELFSVESKAMHKDQVKINEEIKEGLKNREFLLYYQPIFNLKTEEMVGAEVLLRWKHPKLGLIAAEKFLNVAEKTGLIVDVGEYVFKEAVKQKRLWDNYGLKKIKTTLNLSLREMHIDKFIEKLEILFKDNSVDPRDFNLDISEKTAMLNIEQTAIEFKQFKDLGFSISLDHFGTSTSSLKHLQMLPLLMIKIDRSLIFDLSSNLDHQITVKAMIALIHELGFEVVAEGVETSKESALLYDFGCDHAQGYLFSKPLSALEFQELLK